MKRFVNGGEYSQSTLDGMSTTDHEQFSSRRRGGGPDGQSSIEKLQNTTNLRLFNELISSLIIAMKPKITQMYFKRFTKEMVKEFFREIREELGASA